MTDEMRVVTNNVPRDVIDAWELTPVERQEFDYLDWNAIQKGEDSASFFRYRGRLYDLGEFIRSETFGWDGYMGETFFSAILVRYVENGERVVVGLALS